jgi:hypothetical protein
MRALFQVTFLLLFFSLKGLSQDTIFLENPSFEDVPIAGQMPSGWHNCGTMDETPPDIQPGLYKVEKIAQDGYTYLGLVVRDNETWEAVGQRLLVPLKVATSYAFSLYLSRSELYITTSKLTGQEINSATPVMLRIWGGKSECEKKELLAETGVIINREWQLYDFDLTPMQADYTFITLEAYYKTPVLFPYNGNLLIDNCSAIVKITSDK